MSIFLVGCTTKLYPKPLAAGTEKPGAEKYTHGKFSVQTRKVAISIYSYQVNSKAQIFLSNSYLITVSKMCFLITSSNSLKTS